MKWNNVFNMLFSMSKTEKNGAIVLLILVVLVLIFRISIPYLVKDKEDYSEEINSKIEQLKAMNDSIQQAKKTPEFRKNYSKSGSAYKPTKSKFEYRKQEDVEIEYFSFDPNTAEYKDLMKLGFTSKTANTLINYREKGGKFKVTTDLLKLYGLDSVLFVKLQPYIKIASVVDDKSEALKTQIKIEINSADSAQLTSLKGIGPSFASRICKYRSLLGGFYRKEQIMEVYKFPIETFELIKEYIYVDTTSIQKININFADVSELKKHPYFNYALARKLVDYRSQKGSINSINQLMSDSVFTKKESEKLHPYLSVN